MKEIKKLPSECTTIIVGNRMTADGSRILARSSDFDAMMAINFEVHEDTLFGPSEFIAKDSKFHCPLPLRLWATQRCLIISSQESGEVLATTLSVLE